MNTLSEEKSIDEIRLLVYVSKRASKAQAPPADCEALGFASPACTSCESLAEYVKDESLAADCKRCCVRDEQDAIKCAQVTLEVCPYRLNGLPHIQDFISKHMGPYKKQLSVVRSVGAYPKLICKAVGGERKSIRIDNWRVATLREFLDERLEPAAAAAGKPAKA